MNKPKVIQLNAEEQKIFSLLLDENEEVASLAIKKIMERPFSFRDKLIALMQENSDPHVRKRIHQLSVIHQVKVRLFNLQQEVKQQVFCLWHKLWELNDLHLNALTAQGETANFLHQLISKMKQANVTDLAQVAKYMHDNNFIALSKADNFDSENYTIEKLVEEGMANDILFCALIQYIMLEMKLPGVNFAIYRGGYGLVDEQNNWLSPTDNWQITKLLQNDNVKICPSKEFYKLFLTLKITALLTEGNLQDFAFYGEHLTQVRQQNWDEVLASIANAASQELPFPEKKKD